ncbi:MAG: U32 family peptidase [Oscillospiraceae bacterium]
MSPDRRTELLAPAGGPESVTAAVLCGADAIYIGGERFSARANARNFTDSEIKEAVRYCHLHGVKVQRAMNVMIFDSETDELARAAEFSAECGIDALIVQDWGAARIIKSVVPDMPLHASTQMTIHSAKGAEEAAKMGFSRVVLSRELPLEIIREICSTGIETEVFVHGALCMCVSGQCYMSAAIGSRSANRGQCAQACRLPFNALSDGSERYDLSLKDLSYIENIAALAEAGVSSFKIEGRMKRAEYVAAAVTACRAALDGRQPDMDTLRAVFSRSGFTDGYLDGKTGREMFGYRRKDDVTAAAEVLPGLKELYRSEQPAYTLDMKLSVRENTPAVLKAECDGLSAEVRGDIPEAAVNRPLTGEYAEKQLSKLGGTAYRFGSLSADIGEGLILSCSALNKLRRDAVSELDRLIIEKNTPRYAVYPDYYEDFGDIYSPRGRAKTRIHIKHRRQLEAALELADFVIMPAEEAPDKADDRIIIGLPCFTLDEKFSAALLDRSAEKGYNKLYCGNIAHIALGRERGFELFGGFRLNCANSYSIAQLADMGLKGVTASVEMKLHDISALGNIAEISVIVYGNIPVMLTRNCPVRQAVGCKDCTGRITDRTGRNFAVSCDKKRREYAEVYNCDTLYMADRIREINGADCFDYLFTDESADEIKRTMARCRSGNAPGSGFTRGLYYRGVL